MLFARKNSGTYNNRECRRLRRGAAALLAGAR